MPRLIKDRKARGLAPPSKAGCTWRCSLGTYFVSVGIHFLYGLLFLRLGDDIHQRVVCIGGDGIRFSVAFAVGREGGLQRGSVGLDAPCARKSTAPTNISALRGPTCGAGKKERGQTRAEE